MNAPHLCLDRRGDDLTFAVSRSSSAICPSNQPRSCCHCALSGESFVSRAMIAWPCRSSSRACALSPDWICTLASLEKLTERSRCRSALPGFGGGEALSDGEAVGIGFHRARKIALRLLHAANLFVGHRQIALPYRITGIGFRQPVEDGEAVGIRFQRGLKIALRLLHVADLFVGHREITLPARVAELGISPAGR
jgi:hypothetical protein